jgi:hypothetical protein
MADNEEILDYEEEDVHEEPQVQTAVDEGKKGYVGVHSSGFKDMLLRPEIVRAVPFVSRAPGLIHHDANRSEPSQIVDSSIRLRVRAIFVAITCADSLTPPVSSSPARVHPQRDGRHGHLVPGEVRYGQNGRVRPRHLAAARPQGGRGFCAGAVPHAGAGVPGKLPTRPPFAPACALFRLFLQICAEFERFAKHMPNVKIGNFFGGLPIKTNVELLKSTNCPNIVVGTPGRIKQVCSHGFAALFLFSQC